MTLILRPTRRSACKSSVATLALTLALLYAICASAAPGKTRVVEKIEISGNKRTKKRVILKSLTFGVGDEITDDDIDAGIRNLKNLELFYKIQVNEIETETAGIVGVEVKVKEKWSIIPLPIISRSSDADVKLGLRYEDFNMGGRAHYLKIRTYRKWAHDLDDDLGIYYDINFVARNFLYRDITFAPGISNGKSLEETFDDGDLVSQYKKDVDSYRVKIGKTLGYIEAGLSYSSRSSEYSHYSGEPQNFENTDIKSMGPYFSYNNINSLDNNLYEGYEISLSVINSNEAIGSDVSSTTYGFGFKHFIYLGKRKNMAYKIRAALVSGTVVEDVELGVGGSTSLRGYERDEFKGARMLQVNTEYRFPITDKYWGGVTFIDGGNAWEKGSEIEVSDMNWSAGLGLRLFIRKLVKGVLRLDIARNLSRREYKGYIGVHHTF